MSVEIKVPALGESVSEATVARWLKKPGDAVAMDEPLVELETDKVTLEVNATAAGVLESVAAEEGANVEVGALLGSIGEGSGAPAAKPTAKAEAPAAKPAAAPAPAKTNGGEAPIAMPSAAKIIAENSLDAGAIAGSGKGGRILKEDAQAAASGGARPAAAAPGSGSVIEVPAFTRPESGPRPKKDREERVRMTKLRKTIATRLKQAQNNAAMLTTFNEVDMTALMALRNQYKDSFEKKHGVKLGFMSFFVKACIVALKELPAVNGEIDGDDLVYKNYYDIGVAVGTPNGLVVPVVRDADGLTFAEVEKTIGELGRKARDGKLSMADLTGGTFTISNGGVYGSLMSTPILNPPQSGILGMHKIQERPMAVGGKVEIRPMMYLALSYDHRIIDGREAVTFLVRVKECLEDPQRILLDM
ncbi:2-oxoglutarate dehydrogenase E2 component (dihydrolipoamide succinyltransferase) [Inquilinus ginsengisoli]|uniref:2-oxoglutarate dehydrogenase complex dihydrolipoyllysine-residue succinyltransferase n=1 Tax=Inquilinus ginsengisoli TaxID=363840 RepID=UPI003D1EA2EC